MHAKLAQHCEGVMRNTVTAWVAVLGTILMFVGCNKGQTTKQAGQAFGPATQETSSAPLGFLLHEETPQIDVYYAWLMPAPLHGSYLARAIVSASDPCPTLQVNTESPIPMELRANPNRAFPVRVCELHFAAPAEPSTVQIGKISLLAPALETVSSFYTLGDTGCDDEEGQNCNTEWFFKRNIEAIVANANAELIVHNGDYVYRTKNCPSTIRKQRACKTAAFRDTWHNWEYELFAPAKALLERAPWIFVRGNHEQCKESYQGYYRFLDPWPYPGDQCEKDQEVSKGYALSLNKNRLNLLVTDTSAATDDPSVYSRNKAVYEAIAQELVQDFSELASEAKSNQLTDTWVLTHRPAYACAPWGVGIFGWCSAGGYLLREKVLKNVDTSHFSRLLSGHIHHLSMTDFADQGPMQIIVGNGGALLSPDLYIENVTDGSRPVKESIDATRYGFAHVTPAPNDTWTFDVYSDTGVKVESYTIEQKRFVKEPSGSRPSL